MGLVSNMGILRGFAVHFCPSGFGDFHVRVSSILHRTPVICVSGPEGIYVMRIVTLTLFAVNLA